MSIVDSPSTTNAALCLSAAPFFDSEQVASPIWMILLLICLTASYGLSLAGIIQQYRLSVDETTREKEY